jgi:hypothetical protein
MPFSNYIGVTVFAVLVATAFVQASPLPQNLNMTFPRQVGQALAQVIYGCAIPNTVALTFDDGPYIYVHVRSFARSSPCTLTRFLGCRQHS